ncbi:MAG: hypothetical protein D8M57_06055 [Candidatus Scalindua sp. AMX11]|nr:MAG: hypothetical protein DWQ00_13010 [Candidatus Scalindua sp.]TDE65865.1 MAG: hypothetical protein D8M57_06055 [Candidatus Scalindua sp. AMX11]
MKLCAEAKMLQLGVVALDGTKVERLVGPKLASWASIVQAKQDIVEHTSSYISFSFIFLLH